MPPAATRPVEFVADIQPIFEAKCLKCHGPEKQKSEYRLDQKETALKGGENHAPNIRPGDGAESPLLRFVAGLDPELRMPPKGEGLSREQLGLLRAWIDQGAIWPESASAKRRDPLDWWSLKPLSRPQPPPGAANPIDGFIAKKLAENALQMSPEADWRTLCRRLYFDLIGLPPTPEEIDAFAADPDPAAYGRLVDHLLASPRHGERWARHWLDVVHYADTHGYDKDQPRPNAWPYRDYVIRAFNDDKPYARFVEEQIAGDALFPGTRDGIEALGFVAAGPWDLIGHSELPEEKTDGKVARHLDRDDMVATTLGTFCSATVQCAQCHNHKLDPFSQEDYYAIQAVFAAIDRTTIKYYADDESNQRSRELQGRQNQIAAAVGALETPLQERAGEALRKLDVKIAGASGRKQGNENPDFGYHSSIAPEQLTTKWVQVDLGERVAIDHVTLLPCYDDFNQIGAGFGFPVRFKVETSDDPEFHEGVTLLWRKHDATFMNDFPNPGLQPFTTGGAKDDGIAGRYVRVTATKLAPRKDDFIFALAELQVFDANGRNVAALRPVTSFDSIEAPPRWRRSNLTDGLAPVSATADEKAELVAEREALLLSVADQETRQKRASLLQEQREIAAALSTFPKPLEVFAGAVHHGSGNFRGTGPQGGKPRPIFVLTRGQVTQPGPEARPGAVSSLKFAPGRFALSPNDSEGIRRAALARWITNRQNPLTWRSIVNRVWQYHFGRGLVDTANDFGRMGGTPTHPELLDWLAAEFRDGGGSLKRLHKMIVMSAAYRQSSTLGGSGTGTGTPRAPEIDAGNTLLWRQNRRKLEAEAIRDAILAVAGKLDLKMGGPGWKDFVLEHPEHSPHYEYGLFDPENASTWRRSIYRFIVRSQMQPFLTSLDCADPSIRVDRRNESVSAPQALTLLNNGFMLVQARHFAERVKVEANENQAAQVDRAHRLALGRLPTDAEREQFTAFSHQHGLRNLCRVLFNLNEFAFAD